MLDMEHLPHQVINNIVLRRIIYVTNIVCWFSVAGADMHKSYLDSNGSDLSLSNVSTWLHTKKLQSSDRNKKRVSYATIIVF